MNNILRIHIDTNILKWIILGLILPLAELVGVTAHAAPILGSSPETSPPVHVAQGAAPLVLLTVARDHSMAFPAYNDMTDLNGDGVLDTGFNPSFSYLGLFNPKYCYTYVSTAAQADQYFTPAAQANALTATTNPGGCTQTSPATYWSGNWLNYMTTSRMDAMRVALYGGYRDVDRADGSDPQTILRRAYIPQDGHAWGKEYISNAAVASGGSGYTLLNYAPFDEPGLDHSSQLFHLFGNLTTTVDSTNHSQTLHQSRTDSSHPWQNNQIFIPTVPNAANGHSLGHVTSTVDDVGKSCATLNVCSNFPPLLRVIQKSGTHVWRWASSQRPVLDYHPNPIGYVAAYPGGTKGNFIGFGNLGDDLASYPTNPPTLTDYTVRVAVCTLNFRDGCKAYTTNSGTYYKPTGVLQDYGDNNSVKFGLMTGSYDNNMSGGRIRKNITTNFDEVNADGTFRYKTDTSRPSIVQQLDNIRIRNFNNPTESQNTDFNAFVVPNYANMYFGNNFIYKNTWSYNNSMMTDGNYGDWGNPIAEMMFEGLRYFAGGPDLTTGKDLGVASKSKTPAYNLRLAGAASAIVEDTAVGLENPLWDDPYADTTQWCAKPNLMLVSGPNPSFDSDQLPGSPFAATAFGVNLNNVNNVTLNVGTSTNYVGVAEGINSTSRFIGENWAGSAASGARDRNPTLKDNVSLEQIRGLVPDETDNQGSFLSAGVAYWAKRASLRAVGGKNIPTVDTYAMVLNSPYPSIKVKFSAASGLKPITIIPFGKTLGKHNSTLAEQQADWQPTNQIVGVYPTLLNDPNNEAGNFRFTFYVNFEDHSWGGDFEMDFVVQYDIQVVSGPKVQVTVTPFAQAGSDKQNAGYYITGTTQDGAYVVVQTHNETPAVPYFLNTPTSHPPGWCNGANWNGVWACAHLVPYSYGTPAPVASVVNHTPGSVSGAAADNELKNPLWYAARWGGKDDGDAAPGPLPADGKPSHYIQVNSPANLKVAFQKMIQSILDNSATVGAVTSSSGEIQASSTIFTASYNAGTFWGELTATPYIVTPGTPSSTVTYGTSVTANSQFPASFSDRKVLFTPLSGGTPLAFTYDNLHDSGWDTLFDSADVINFITGDTSKDIFHGGSLRTRASLLGTVVDSMPVYSQDTGDVYVGSNDGMLHAFDASTMQERFAFIPNSMITTLSGSKSILNLLSSASFTGRYYVDGNIAVSSFAQADANMNSSYSYLIGFLGRGGRGFYGVAIDKSTHSPKSSWEYSNTVTPADYDLGYLLGQPVLEKLSDGTNVAIFGNGYGSDSNQAALYVVRLWDGTLLAKFQTCSGGGGTTTCGTSSNSASPNGLATPGMVRKNGFVSYAYAGDYLGNVWKFDLSGITGSSNINYQFNGTNGAGHIFNLFSTPNSQPIVAPITAAYSYDSMDNDVRNKQFFFFGTGSDLTTADINSTQGQSIYGLIDPMTPASPTYSFTPAIASTRGTSSGNLRLRTLDSAGSSFAGYKSATNTVNVRTMGSASPGDMSGMTGWVMDLSAPAGPSEKVFTAATLRSAATPALVVSSTISSTGTCVASGAGYLNAFDAYHGGSLPNSSYFDINRNGSTADEKISTTNHYITSIDFGIGAIGRAGFTGDNVIVQGSGAKPAGSASNMADVGTIKSTAVSRRTSWREVIN